MTNDLYIWHDDVRKPPAEGWVWARDNLTAKAILEQFEVKMIDLDHDLGGDHIDPDSPDAIYYKGDSEDNGMKLVDWMIRTGNLPHFIRVHSWNPVGAQKMVRALQAAGHTRVRYRPYEAPDSQQMTRILKAEANV